MVRGEEEEPDDACSDATAAEEERRCGDLPLPVAPTPPAAVPGLEPGVLALEPPTPAPFAFPLTGALPFPFPFELEALLFVFARAEEEVGVAGVVPLGVDPPVESGVPLFAAVLRERGVYL